MMMMVVVPARSFKVTQEALKRPKEQRFDGLSVAGVRADDDK
jgi:hypothetical protein